MGKKPFSALELLKDRRGSSFVEFGILAGIFFTVTFAIIEFGLMMWLNSTVEHVAAEGARYAAVRGAGKPAPVSESDVIAYVQDRTDGIQDSDLTVKVTWTPNNSSGSTVTVLVTYTYDYIIGEVMGFDTVDLQGRSTMIVN